MKKKLLPQMMLATFAAHLFMMTMPLTARAQNSVSTITTTENITRTSTLYVGEVVVDGETKIKYLYSEDMTLYYDIIQYLHNDLKGMADVDYAALLEGHEFVFPGETATNGFAICSNPELVAEMDGNWSNAQYLRTLYYPDKGVSSETNSNLYDIDEGFKAALDAQTQQRAETINTPVDAGKCILLHIDSHTTTDVYYTIEDGAVVRHSDITVTYDCEATTVIYTKVELNSGGGTAKADVNNDNKVDISDIVSIINFMANGTGELSKYDVNGDNKVDISDIVGVINVMTNGSGNQEAKDPAVEAGLCPDTHHPHSIDMGDAGKWSCCNVGASAPWEFGKYYAWGEINDKDSYSWGTYEHSDGNSSSCHELGSDIAGTQYDAANVNGEWEGEWRMPSYEQLMLLINNDKITTEWITVNEVGGRKFTSPDGKSIFLPAAGHRWNANLYDKGNNGYYWTSTLKANSSTSAYYFNFYRGGVEVWDGERFYGMCIRPLSDEE